ncbi:MAG: hypothetical protein ACE5E1_01100, partial [Phycisphaerae bacterium]
TCASRRPPRGADATKKDCTAVGLNCHGPAAISRQLSAVSEEARVAFCKAAGGGSGYFVLVTHIRR